MGNTVAVADTNIPLVKNICIENISPKPDTKCQSVVNPVVEKENGCGKNADVGFSASPLKTNDAIKEKQIKFADDTEIVAESFNASVNKITGIETTVSTMVYRSATRLSPRLEMRLALNHDILGDEDLISFDPGPPNLEAILGRDLLSYHRFTGRDLMSRTVNHRRVAPKEANISFCTQKNSKMDTPTPNRKKPSLNPNTWNNSACATAGKRNSPGICSPVLFQICFLSTF